MGGGPGGGLRGGRRGGIASAVVVALVATTLTWLAVTSDGATVHEADLNDGGVWVASSRVAKVARLNKPAGQFDAGLASSSGPGEPLDVLQDDRAVLSLNVSSGQLTPVEPRLVRFADGASVVVPAARRGVHPGVFTGRQVDLRGGTAAMVDPATGVVHASRVDPRRGITSLPGLSVGARPLARVGPAAAVAVDVRGNVHAVSGTTGTVVTVPATATGFGRPVTARLGEVGTVDITAVGTTWVVLVADSGHLYSGVSKGAMRAEITRAGSAPAYAALQQPGEAAGTVAVQTADAVRLVDLDGSDALDAVRVDAPPGGERATLSRPLRLGGCLHAAWSTTTTTYYGRACAGDTPPAPARTLSIQRPEGTAQRDGVVVRTNHRLVVLNDLDSGDVWDVDSQPKKLDEWDSLIPPPKVENTNRKKDENLLEDAQLAQPPKAEPDELRVRPGRTSKLHVLDNDTDPSGSILAIDPGDLSTPTLEDARVSVSSDGQSVDVLVPPQPKAQVFTFTYKVNNGVSEQRSQATVRVTVVPESENTAPVLRQGPATLVNTLYKVSRGRVLPVQVVGDWRDKESDPVCVEALADGSSVDGLGRLTVLAPGRRGPASIPYQVTDGRAATRAKVNLDVLGPDDPLSRPQAQPDVVRGVVGKPLQLQPLGNDVGGADPAEPDARLRLSREVPSTGSLVVDTNLDTGVLTITGSAPGSFVLTYGAQTGGGIAAGRIRVDLIADPDPDAPPVTVPDSAMLRDQSPTLTDVLANDYSPRADVLVTRSISLGQDESWLRASIYKGRWVRIEATQPNPGSGPRRATVGYVVSDGSHTATGEVAVTQRAGDDGSEPVVEDDEAVVRAGDSVTIPALDNDTMAGGIPLVLDPASVTVLDGAQQAFASGDLIRYVPEARRPSAPLVRTIEYAAYPVGHREKAQTGRVTVTVMPQPTAKQPNQPPVARSFSTSVVAGEPLVVTVPTTGIDPDGDSATVEGIVGSDSGPVDLELGRVTAFGASTITYEAYPLSAGTEVLHYEIRDRYGARSRGFVRIGVVQPGDPQPPVAVPDEVRARPGKTVSIDVTRNDLIARGDTVELLYKAPVNDAAVLAGWRVDEKLSTFTTKVHEPDRGVQNVTYAITNGLFDPSRAAVTVIPTPDAANPPVALDDTARPGPGATSAVVDVLANDTDVDGAAGTLRVTKVLSPDGTVEGGRVRVAVKPYPYAVPYVVTDEDGLSAMALVHVPTGDKGLPYVIPGGVIEMDRDSTKAVRIGDYVRSPRGRAVSLVTAENLSASPRDRLTVTADGRAGLVLRSSGGYAGPAAVMLEVSDQERLDQKDFATAYISVPVQIGPKVPLLRCPDYQVSVNAGGLPRTVDIPTLCHAWLPIGTSLDDVRWDAAWDPQPARVELERRGSGGRLLVLSAPQDAPSSGTGRIRVGVQGASQVAFVRLRVLGILGDAEAAADRDGKPLPSVRAPVVRPFRVDGLRAGQSRSVSLAPYLDSPLAKPSCSISAARAGSGVSVGASGCTLRVTAASGARGAVTVDVSVSDGPGRSAPGRGTVTVLGVPAAPRAVSAEADRVQGGSARVRWSPPAFDGGSPITSYEVAWTGGGRGQRGCSASPCTVTGLRNGVTYTFTVRARNAVGLGPASAASGPVKPDTLPNPVGGVAMASRGDGYVVAGWPAPPPKGSAVTAYQVRAVDTTTGTIHQETVAAPTRQARIAGLTNNDAHRVSVRARNDLGWGPFGEAVTMQSAGTPRPVAAPTLSPRGPGAAYSSESLKVSWAAVSPNGPDLTKYTVIRSVGGASTAIRTVSPDTRSITDTIPYDGRTYHYAVTATNGAGNTSAPSHGSSFSSTGKPATPGAPSATTPGPTSSAKVTVRLGSARGAGYTSLRWRTTAGQGGVISCGCAQDAVKSLTATGLGTSQQRIQVQVSNGRTWSDWSALSGSFHPFGPTNDPVSQGSSASGKTITYRWSWSPNGRPVDHFTIYWGGQRQATVGAGGRSFTHTWGSYATDYDIRVSAVAQDSGESGRTLVGGRTDNPPQADIVGISKGVLRPSICGDCYQVTWGTRNVRAGSYGFHCYRNGRADPFYDGTVTVAGDGSHSGDWCALSASSFTQVRVTLTGGPSAPVDSGWHAW